MHPGALYLSSRISALPSSPLCHICHLRCYSWGIDRTVSHICPCIRNDSDVQSNYPPIFVYCRLCVLQLTSSMGSCKQIFLPALYPPYRSFELIDAKDMATSSGYSDILEPKAPPISGAITLTVGVGLFNISAIALLASNGSCVVR